MNVSMCVKIDVFFWIEVRALFKIINKDTSFIIVSNKNHTTNALKKYNKFKLCNEICVL